MVADSQHEQRIRRAVANVVDSRAALVSENTRAGMAVVEQRRRAPTPVTPTKCDVTVRTPVNWAIAGF